ncbi:hypothetical protein ACT17Q_14990 [Cellulomonas sp. CW35]|uniref:Uncharacterized protein n=1 Tax=Cellulomonas uda TaxID=1714 RepID=A0A4Y3KI08_CELUD|nr:MULTISPECIES: hypothetical protein [Cellulomonas]ASR56215.1 hypothetical protein CBP52_15170 [Cellulomonas sp. PSBB021]NII66131.1 hypothetical protein [Cellulomonas uda]GEA82628.1 hypothetical protein CUD01_30720 [Cellulomonas uda]
MTALVEQAAGAGRVSASRRSLRTEHWAAIATVGLLAAHIGLRDGQWTHEWTLSIWQYSFATIMLAPACAGFGAWKAVAAAKAYADGAAAAGRQTAVVWRSTLVVSGWVLAAFLAGFLVVQTVMLFAGPPGAPAPSDYLPVLSCVAMLVAFTSFGCWVGWRVRSYIAPPLLALVCFAGCVALYTTSLSFLSDTGGATGSLVGLRPNPARVLLQLVVFGLLTVVFTVSAGKDAYRTARARFGMGALAVVAVGAVLVGALAGPERLLPDPNDPVRCAQADGGPRVCVGPGYADEAGEISAALAAPVAKLRSAGVDVDLGRFDQRPSAPGAHVVNPGMLTRGALAAPQYVANTVMSSTCALEPDAATAFGVLAWWLAPDGRERDSLVAPGEVSSALRSADPAVFGPEVRRLVSVLREC